MIAKMELAGDADSWRYMATIYPSFKAAFHVFVHWLVYIDPRAHNDFENGHLRDDCMKNCLHGVQISPRVRTIPASRNSCEMESNNKLEALVFRSELLVVNCLGSASI